MRREHYAYAMKLKYWFIHSFTHSFIHLSVSDAKVHR